MEIKMNWYCIFAQSQFKKIYQKYSGNKQLISSFYVFSYYHSLHVLTDNGY